MLNGSIREASPTVFCIRSAYLSAVERLCPALELCGGVRVCQVGSSAPLLISSVHVGSGAAAQSEKPRSPPHPSSFSVSLARENRNSPSQRVKHVLTKDKLLAAERGNTIVLFVFTLSDMSRLHVLPQFTSACV